MSATFTCTRASKQIPKKQNVWLIYLEEVLSDEGEPLCMIAYALEVGVLVQHRVEGVQEKVKRVLVQEVYLEQDANKRQS